tara:strand:+ start:51084 stop:52058 length:975 start_codon:yes stop_codon:yes gene_type:complete
MSWNTGLVSLPQMVFAVSTALAASCASSGPKDTLPGAAPIPLATTTSGSVGDEEAGDEAAGDEAAPTTKNEPHAALLAELEQHLASANWQAVDLAKRLGGDAWPAVEAAAQQPEFRTRQIAMACAGALGTSRALPLLIAGLGDPHRNVSIAAASQLSLSPPPGAQAELVRSLGACEEDVICALLVRGLGRLPGERSIAAVLDAAQRSDALLDVARLALSKLGDKDALRSQRALLKNRSAAIRYQALVDTRYIANATLIVAAKPLLQDTAPVVSIGTPYNEQHRRVCDQAVDTLVVLLQLEPSFAVAAETIYSDEQIREVARLAR